MPSYDHFPIRGYSYEEPHGPRNGRSYRDADSDRRILIGLAGLFVFGCVCVGIFGFMERKNTLTEHALGDDRHECSVTVGGAVELGLAIRIDEALSYEPALADASTLLVVIEVRSVKGQELLGTVSQTFDVSTNGWDRTRTGLAFRQQLPDDASAQAVAICDVELTILD